MFETTIAQTTRASSATLRRSFLRLRSTATTATCSLDSAFAFVSVRFRFSFVASFALAATAATFFCSFVRTSFASDAPNVAQDARAVQNSAMSSDATPPALGDDAPAFRYWKAPFDAIERWPWGDRKYYPIEISTFDDWLRATSDATKDDSRDDLFSSFSLDAKLDGDALEGVARFSLSLLRSQDADDSTSTGNAPTNEPLLLRPFSFGTSDLREGSGPDAPLARLGLYPDGRLRLVDPKTGDYSFRWSQRGVVDALGAVSFDLVFPASPKTEIRLETPPETTVSSSEGVVEAVIPQDALLVSQQTGSTAPTKRWRVFLGGKPKTRLTISPQTSEFDVRRQVGYRQEISHRVSLEGVEVVSRFTFDRSDALSTDATISFDAPLSLVSLEWDGRKGEELGATQTRDGETTKIKIRRAGASGSKDGKPSELKVVAFRPLELGVEAPLPSIRFQSADAFWTETLCRLLVVRPVVATSTKPIDAAFSRDPLRTRQDFEQDFGDANASGGNGSNAGSTAVKRDAFAFKFFEPNANVSVKFQTPESIPAFDSATDCSLVAGSASAKTTVFFRLDRDSGARLSVPIAPDWEIDAVQTPSAEAVVWSVDAASESEASSTDGGNARRVLTIAFPTRPELDRPTRVVLSARRSKTFEQKIAVDALCPLDLSGLLRGAHALALRAESPYRVKLTTLAGRPFVPSNDAPNSVFGETQIREALPPSSGVDRLYFGDRSADVVASLENATSNYSATLSCVGSLRDRKFVESWRFHCVPASGSRVDQIVFFASPVGERTVASEGNWLWSTSTEPERRFVAERLSADEAGAFDLPDSAVAYAIRLATSRSVPFDLTIEKETAATREIQAPLLFLPDATLETAEFVVESPLGAPFWTRADGLEAISAPLAPSDEYEPLKSAFQYDPTPTNASLGANAPSFKLPRLDVLSTPPTSEPILDVSSSSAWCWFETLDSYFESDGSTRERVSFFVENRGRTSLALLVPKEIDVSTTLAAWVDNERAVCVVDDERFAEKNAFDVVLPSNKRFVCVTFEYKVFATKLFWRRLLKPTEVECDVPIVSGSWSAWIPPEYRLCRKSVGFDDSTFLRFLDGARGFFEAATSRRDSRARLEEVADRFLTRFGDRDELRRTLNADRAEKSPSDADASSNDAKSSSGFAGASVEGASKRAPAAEATPTAPTWGDVFGSSTVLAKLFAPLEEAGRAEDAAQTGESTDESRTVSSVRAPAPFFLYVDRLRCSRLAATPTTPIAFASTRGRAANADSRDVAARTLEEAGFALIFVDADVAILTTPDALAETAESISTVPIRGSAVRRVASRADAVRLRRKFAESNNFSQFVDSVVWRESDARGPWIEPLRDAVAPGWIRVSTTLARAPKGALVVDRYALSALRWIFFVGFVALCWNRRFARPPFFVATLGVALSACQIAPLGVSTAFEGIALGAVCSFAFYLARYVAPLNAAELSLAAARRNASPRQNGPEADGAEIVRKTSARTKENLRRETIDRRRVREREDDDESTRGFVDLERLRKLGGLENGEESRSGDARRGATTFRFLVATAFALVCALVAATFVPFVFASPLVDAPSKRDATSTDAASPAASKRDAPANAPESSNATDDWREPYRVFVPVDEERRVVGPYYWVSDEFYERIRETLKSRPREKNWRIVDARYEGAVNYNAFSETTSLFNLKATYKVFLDAKTATIVLPATQLVSDVGAKFDDRSISPVFDEENKEFRFEINDSEAGEHTLELTLIPPQFSETDGRASFPIPPVPTSRLELIVPIDAPRIDVPSSLGKVSRVSDRLVAELGATDRLVLSKGASAASARATLDVEQFFLLRTRPTQADVLARFVCQTGTGKVRSITIDCAPTYSFSGRCVCDQAEIESIEPPTAQNDSLRITFKKPISGSFALDVDFVARNFSGVGSLLFPQISTARARVSKNWLALVPSGGVKCSGFAESTVSVAAFQAAFGTLDEVPIAAFDLATSANGLKVSTRLERPAPLVSETTTFVFRPSLTEARLDANFESETETFRVDVETPRPFVVDSVSVSAPDGTRLETPDYFLSDDGASFIFREPIKGQFSLLLVGRAKTPFDAPNPLPTFEIKNVDYVKRTLNVYRSNSVYLEGSVPASWIRLEGARNAPLETLASFPKDDARFVAAFERPTARRANGETPSPSVSIPSPSSSATTGSPVASLAETNAPNVAEESKSNAETLSSGSARLELGVAPALSPGEIVVRVNSPKISGVQRVATYRETIDGDWRALVEFRLTIQGGRIDALRVADDDGFALDPLDANSDFVLDETTVDGGRVLVFKPKTPILSTANLTFVATAKNGESNVRLPRFRALPASVREDVSGVVRLAFLPERADAKPIRWETSDLRRLRRPLKSDSDAGRRSSDGDDKRGAVRRGETNRSSTKSTAALASIGTPVDASPTRDRDDLAATSQPLPSIVTDESAMRNEDFSIFEATSDDASASLASDANGLRIARAEHAFYLNSRRQIFGSTVFFVRPSATSECVVVAPADCVSFEATVDGSRRIAERLDANRWRIDLGGTRFGKRLEVSYRRGENVAEPARGVFFGKRDATLTLDVPRIEGAIPERTVWASAFDSFDDFGSRWNVCQREIADSNTSTPLESKDAFAVRKPIPFSGATELLFRYYVGRAIAEFDALESDAASAASVRGVGFERGRERRKLAWNQCEREIARFKTRSLAGSLTDDQRAAIFAVESTPKTDASDPTPDANGDDDSQIPPENDLSATFDRWTLEQYRATLEKKEKLERNFQIDGKTDAEAADAAKELRDAAAKSSPQNLWTFDRSSDARLLFGVTDRNPARIEIVVPAKRFDFFASSFAVAAFLLAATLVLVDLLRTDSKSRGFKSVVFGGLVVAFAIVFFIFGNRAIGLIGIVAIAVEPYLAASASRRAARRDVPDDANDSDETESSTVDDGSDGVPVLDASSTETLVELESTASAPAPVSTSDSETVGERETNEENR